MAAGNEIHDISIFSFRIHIPHQFNYSGTPNSIIRFNICAILGAILHNIFHELKILVSMELRFHRF